MIIERTIGLVLGPFIALYRSFLKNRTLTNKAVWIIWRALYDPPQIRQHPDPRPLWLLVGTPSAFGPEIAYRLRVAQPSSMDVPRYFWYISIYMFYDLSAMVCCWSSVSIRKGIYKFINCVLLITRLLRLVRTLGSHKPVKPHQLGWHFRNHNWRS